MIQQASTEVNKLDGADRKGIISLSLCSVDAVAGRRLQMDLKMGSESSLLTDFKTELNNIQ